MWLSQRPSQSQSEAALIAKKIFERMRRRRAAKKAASWWELGWSSSAGGRQEAVTASDKRSANAQEIAGILKRWERGGDNPSKNRQPDKA